MAGSGGEDDAARGRHRIEQQVREQERAEHVGGEGHLDAVGADEEV